MVKVCPECGSSSLETVVEEAQTYCADCGVVVERGAIVTEVTFTETNGQANVVGQFVSGESGKSSSNLPGFHRTSREQTVARATRRIRQMAGSLKLKPHHIDAANRIYKLALQRNFTNGRKRDLVLAACLYVVIRRTGSPHMLVDLVDVLEDTTVKTLGHTFLELCQSLNIQPPLVDPSLYIHLEFGDKEQAVAETALRFVQRMSRDWINTGRRPSGVCGAALIMAARVHGFRRTPDDIIPIVRVGDSTLRKRIVEFTMTPSSSLTPAEFESMDLKSEFTAPPVFMKHRQKEERLISDALAKIETANNETQTQNENPNQANKETQTQTQKSQASANNRRGVKRARDEDDEDDESESAQIITKSKVAKKDASSRPRRGQPSRADEPSSSVIDRILEEEADALPSDAVAREIRDALDEIEDLKHLTADDLIQLHQKISQNLSQASRNSVDDDSAMDIDERSAGDGSSIGGEHSSGKNKAEELRRLIANSLSVVKGAPQEGDIIFDPNLPENLTEVSHKDENGLETFSDVDDEEIDCYIFKDEAKATKSKLWHHFNKDWIEERALKEQQMRDLLVNGKAPRRSRKRIEAATAGEAAQQVLEKKMTAKSSRINWEALQVKDLLERLEESGIEGQQDNAPRSTASGPVEEEDDYSAYANVDDTPAPAEKPKERFQAEDDVLGFL